jgi:hypothetical protein
MGHAFKMENIYKEILIDEIEIALEFFEEMTGLKVTGIKVDRIEFEEKLAGDKKFEYVVDLTIEK